ncbi:unnamed protein product [Paramecium octaurelia]|uniref:Transmembrane protein n=1 Tax=Paramecium octaurelia TaxID=43137 RepID=A0A8S1XEE6_PAROT|nr:unnamed protein product [Paramecium octaurelia]
MKLIINSLSQNQKKICVALIETIYYLSILKQFTKSSSCVLRNGKVQYNSITRLLYYFKIVIFLSLQTIILVRIIVNRIRKQKFGFLTRPGLINFQYNFYLTIIQNSEQAESLIPSVPIYTESLIPQTRTYAFILIPPLPPIYYYPETIQEANSPSVRYQQYRENRFDQFTLCSNYKLCNRGMFLEDLCNQFLKEIDELQKKLNYRLITYSQKFVGSALSSMDQLDEIMRVKLKWITKKQTKFEQRDFNELDILQNVFIKLNTQQNVFKELKNLLHYSDKNVMRKPIR